MVRLKVTSVATASMTDSPVRVGGNGRGDARAGGGEAEADRVRGREAEMREKSGENASLLNGPQIQTEGNTEIVTDQAQVDDLLDSLGF